MFTLFTSEHPGRAGGTNVIESPDFPGRFNLSYAYSEGGRVLTSTSEAGGESAHTLDVFDTLRVTRASYRAAVTDYRVRPQNEVGFLAGGAARVFFDRDQELPQAGATPLQVYLTLGDHLGVGVCDRQAPPSYRSGVEERATGDSAADVVYDGLEVEPGPGRPQGNHLASRRAHSVIMATTASMSSNR